jgi:signal transduction histidine kinase
MFHPIGLAVRNHIIVYILSLLALIILEALAVFTMRKVYSNRMSYELMRQDLTRSIAHDLKTPLAVTKAYTENWEYIDEKDRHEYTEKLNAEVDNMAAMINNMLNMSKLDSEKDLKLEEVELYAMTSAIYERMKPLIAERGLKAKLITDVIGGKYYVKADPKMIKIAIGNFITNAVKYAESKVEIKLLGKDKKVTFMVTNDGEGISKKEIKRIWEPFYKTDKARTDRMGSSGMGLAINSSILRLHKAKYKCISDKTETSFWFELKRVK